MTTQTPDLATLATRRENLEQQHTRLAGQNLRLRLGLALLALLTVLALASSFDVLNWKAPWAGGTVTATEFLLQDETGKRRASLRLSAGEPVLEFLGPYGTPRVELAAHTDQSRLALYEAL